MGAVRSIHGLADRHVTIDRDDDLYQAYADVALSDDGRMICVWREAAGHPSGGWARLVFRESTDLGRTWGERRVLADESTCHWAMPRINKLPDGTLLINASGFGNIGTAFLFRSTDGGRTWSEAQPIPVTGFQGRRLVQLPDGTLLLPLVEGILPRRRAWRLRHRVVLWASTDGGREWQFRAVVAESSVHSHSEGPIVRLTDGTLVCHMREDSFIHYPSFKCYSYDDGHTWSEPQESGVFMAQPNAYLLSDGDLLLAYEQVGGFSGVAMWRGDGHDTTDIQASCYDGHDGCATLTPEGLRIRTTGDEAEIPPYYLLHPAENELATIVFEARLRVVANPCGDQCCINVMEAGELRIFPGPRRIRAGRNRLRWQARRLHRGGRDHRFAFRGRDPVAHLPHRQDARPHAHRERGWGGVHRHRPPAPHPAPGQAALGARGARHQQLRRHLPHPGMHSVRNAYAPRANPGESYWHSVSLTVRNPTLPDYRYRWNAASGTHPNQYERDHLLEVVRDPGGDSGEPGCVELPDGRIFCVYQTASDVPRPYPPPYKPQPYIRGSYVHPGDFPDSAGGGAASGAGVARGTGA